MCHSVTGEPMAVKHMFTNNDGNAPLVEMDNGYNTSIHYETNIRFLTIGGNILPRWLGVSHMCAHEFIVVSIWLC